MNKAELLGKYIKDIRLKKFPKLESFSIASGINKGTLSRLENGKLAKNISPFLLKDVAEVLEIDYKDLYRIVGYLEEEPSKGKGNINHVVEGDYIQVPLYDSVSAGMGLEPDPTPVDFIPMPASMGKGCVAINVEGDSMETTINNGSVVLVKRDTEVGNNEIGVFLHEEEAVVKRFRCIDKKCYLVSDNKEYPAREVRKGDDFKVCGKVVWIMNKA